ncbi:MAG: SDR family oxidoreductase [Bacteroidia bacterium]|nr:SDR family oxidoreductase [Bacteroidia bacterium]
MILELTGKKALVCGSTRGIGKAVAMELASLGASVTLLARNAEDLKRIAGQLPGKGPHNWISIDFNQPALLKSSVSEFIRNEEPVHILVNNTGGPPSGPVFSAATDEFVSAFSNHLVCNHILMQAVVDGMKAAGYGRIINIISTSVKQPLPNLGVSNTVRAAVANWAKTLAGELGPFGITVNNVLPGATATRRLESLIDSKAKKSGMDVQEVRAGMLKEIPAGRFGDPSEIAAAVAFLASPAASYINGINMPVDGGRTACL